MQYMYLCIRRWPSDALKRWNVAEEVASDVAFRFLNIFDFCRTSGEFVIRFVGFFAES